MITPQELVNAQLYPSEAAVMEDALRQLLRLKPDLRVGVAIYRYTHEALSLAHAAALAGVSWPQMHEHLLARGIPIRLGVESLAEAEADVAALREACP
ncbi:UPF0175 family protein [Candidatus Chloroploca sp. M-50]|uniref:UPF0175 family protein n=1 Tax=Candidatus Chloroploca mongolica TaxID=2528176 RepID=A0ABS4DHF1_9CHLR|nr:UPF0175 family protein [Candidatus Chloroploca mongolica]MBP1468877.1 UPF0175 family protein [Candidatus Chloroploca mongolica]